MDWLWLIILSVIFQIGFIIYLFLCLWTGGLWPLAFGLWLWPKRETPSPTRTRKEVQKQIKRKFDPQLETLRRLLTDFEEATLDDGMFRFSERTEEAQKKMFKKIQTVKFELLIPLQTYEVKQYLKKKIMTNPFDLRGGRQLQWVLEQYQNCETTESKYSPSWFDGQKRKYSPSWFDGQKRNFFGDCVFGCDWMASIETIVFPCLLIIADMFYTDTKVIIELNNYADILKKDQQEGMTNFNGGVVIILSNVLVVIYVYSFLAMISRSTITCFQTAYNTSSRMSKEKSSIPIESVTRFDVSLDESTTESSLQNAIQWMSYLTIVYLVGTVSVEEDAKFQFDVLWQSGLLATVSLTYGQMTANKILMENQTTLTQDCLLVLACLGSVISSQLLVTLYMVTFADVALLLGARAGGGIKGSITMVAVLAFFIISIAILSIYRMVLIRKKFRKSSVLTVKCLKLFSMLSVQPLHLQTSKTRIVTWNLTYYPGPEFQDWLFKENLVAHIVMSFLSLILFTISQILSIYNPPKFSFIPPDLPYSSSFPARRNFFIIASIGIPVGWILAQGLVRLFFRFDLGASTCGARFEFDNLENNVPEARDSEDNVPQTYFKMDLMMILIDGDAEKKQQS